MMVKQMGIRGVYVFRITNTRPSIDAGLIQSSAYHAANRKENGEKIFIQEAGEKKDGILKII